MHEKTTHTCAKCGKQFTRKYKLKEHIEQKHAKPKKSKKSKNN
jgi:predicted restriction endonuclease